VREAGGDHSGVTAAPASVDRIVIEVTASPARAFLDRMIALVEGAIRQKTPTRSP